MDLVAHVLVSDVPGSNINFKSTGRNFGFSCGYAPPRSNSDNRLIQGKGVLRQSLARSYHRRQLAEHESRRPVMASLPLLPSLMEVGWLIELSPDPEQ